MALTREEFAEQYAANSGVTVEWLKEQGREPRPCHCGPENGCEGWQMARVGSTRAEGYDWPEDSEFPTDDPRYRAPSP